MLSRHPSPILRIFTTFIFFCLLFIHTIPAFASLIIVQSTEENITYEVGFGKTPLDATKSYTIKSLDCRNNGRERCKILVACSNSGWWAVVGDEKNGYGASCGHSTRSLALNDAYKSCLKLSKNNHCPTIPSARKLCASGLDNHIGPEATTQKKNILKEFLQEESLTDFIFGDHNYRRKNFIAYQFTCEPNKDFSIKPTHYRDLAFKNAKEIPSNSQCAKNLDLFNKTELVLFYAEWCKPCRDMLETMGKIDARYPNVATKVVDIEKNRETIKICKEEKIWKADIFPGLFAIRESHIVGSHHGLRPGREEIQKIEKLYKLINTE